MTLKGRSYGPNNIFGGYLHVCYYRLTNYQIRPGNPCGRGVLYGVSHFSHSSGGVPAFPKIIGTPTYPDTV